MEIFSRYLLNLKLDADGDLSIRKRALDLIVDATVGHLFVADTPNALLGMV
ncbi:hypothetical protein KR51_00009290 [Rubidibacter lacunae KORDI 51-2]|uniref:Uncharacterized protein n=1 Tax=Rubidibacter lacunae KORDI 51-2 TaxID=582515 RepID=U5DL42_9CHRO|nr:hypothetical protein KR51_00009290 [Rubidibacter lacunae KORDI 51-2]